MKSYKVTDPKGITVNGRHIEKGQIAQLRRGAATNTFLHFKQVREVSEKAPAGESKPAEPKAEGSGKVEAEKMKGGDPPKPEPPAK